MRGDSQRNRLLRIYADALNAVEGRGAVRRYLSDKAIQGPVRLLAFGKAAGEMALGAADALGKDLLGGLVIGKYDHLDLAALSALGLDAMEAAHPVPDENCLLAGARVVEYLRREDPAHLLVLISGGASSLVEAPVAGLDLQALSRTADWLLASGLEIGAMNLVRTSLSRIKGGGLSSLVGDRAVTALAISDVPGDDPAVIGSGPLTPRPGLEQSVLALDLPDWLRPWVRAGLRERGEILGPGPGLKIVASLEQAKRAAAEAGRQLGLDIHLHSDFLEGEAGERGRALATQLLQGPPGLHIWGGETTVVLPDQPGRGGRNQHLALSAAIELSGRADACLLSAGTDGSDGPTLDAGGLVDGGTLGRAQTEGLDVAESLAAADSGTVLEATGDLLHTGPSGTNVMDLVLGLKQ